MIVPRARAAILLLLALNGFSTFAGILQSNVLRLSNTSSSEAVRLPSPNISSNSDEFDDCFKPATPRRGLYPAKQEDCVNALDELFLVKNPFGRVTFARRRHVGFQLPKVIRNETCVISIDVLNDADSDTFRPQAVYNAARDIVLRCTEGAFRFGGRTKTGPKKLVDVLVFGRVWPLVNVVVEPVASQSTVAIAEERLTSRDSSSLDEPSVRLTRLSEENKTSQDVKSVLNVHDAGAALKCYDPPLPRERVWPIDFKDCEIASVAIIGDRPRNQKYTFSREPIATDFYYPLPATYRYKSCVVHLDVHDDSDRDTVRLSIVEATAWILAHKCSGKEKPEEQYGGSGTVAVGSKGLINVWVYGRLWPPPVGVTNMTSLVLTQPVSLIDSA